jgi:uncharacterized membrane protein
MTGFLTVLAIFLVSHVLPAVPPWRRALVARVGEPAFIAAYSLMSAGLFAWLIVTARQAPYLPLWPPAPLAYAFAVIMLPLALMLLLAGILAPNPLSISFVPGDPAKLPGIIAITRHPILWGLGLWGLAHVPANGDMVALIMFGGLGGFALLGMAMVERRKRRALGAARWQQLASGTSIVPLAALLAGRARFSADPRTMAGLLAGAVIAIFLLAGGHLWLFARDPLAFF